MTITPALAAALATWTAEVDRAKRAYYAEHTPETDYQRRIRASQKSLRYRAKKKEARDASR